MRRDHAGLGDGWYLGKEVPSDQSRSLRDMGGKVEKADFQVKPSWSVVTYNKRLSKEESIFK